MTGVQTCALPISQALKTSATLHEVLLADARVMQHLSTEVLSQLFDPAHYLGEALAFADRVLADHRQRKA